MATDRTTKATEFKVDLKDESHDPHKYPSSYYSPVFYFHPNTCLMYKRAEASALYVKLMDDCLSEDPQARPTFASILTSGSLSPGLKTLASVAYLDFFLLTSG